MDYDLLQLTNNSASTFGKQCGENHIRSRFAFSRPAFLESPAFLEIKP
jgi:hypothetical protein